MTHDVGMFHSLSKIHSLLRLRGREARKISQSALVILIHTSTFQATLQDHVNSRNREGQRFSQYLSKVARLPNDGLRDQRDAGTKW